MDIRFSIIVCAFNGGKTIERTMESVFRQSYKNYELIIIDDGSTDETEEIVYRYIEKGEYKVRFCKQRNRGIAYSRNKAIKMVETEYFLFLDADDTLNVDLLRQLRDDIIQNKSEIIRYQANEYRNGEKNNRFIADFTMSGVGKALVFEYMNRNIRFGPLWLYCYNTKFFKKNRFRFKNGKIHEDFLNNYILLKAERMSNIKYVGYNYMKKGNSITSIHNLKYEKKRMQDIIIQFNYVVKKISKIKSIKVEELKKIENCLYHFLEYNKKYFKDDLLNKYIKRIRRVEKKWDLN